MSCSVFSLKQTMHDVLWWMSSLLNEILKLHSKNIILVCDLIRNLKIFMGYAFTTKTSQRCNQKQEGKTTTTFGMGGVNYSTLASFLVSKWYFVTLAIVRLYNVNILPFSINLAIHLFRLYKLLKEMELLLI